MKKNFLVSYKRLMVMQDWCKLIDFYTTAPYFPTGLNACYINVTIAKTEQQNTSFSIVSQTIIISYSWNVRIVHEEIVYE